MQFTMGIGASFGLINLLHEGRHETESSVCYNAISASVPLEGAWGKSDEH